MQIRLLGEMVTSLATRSSECFGAENTAFHPPTGCAKRVALFPMHSSRPTLAPGEPQAGVEIHPRFEKRRREVLPGTDGRSLISAVQIPLRPLSSSSSSLCPHLPFGATGHEPQIAVRIRHGAGTYLSLTAFANSSTRLCSSAIAQARSCNFSSFSGPSGSSRVP